MNKPKKCKNCQWYGKPYWSIINPCDSCPNENDYKTIIQIDGEPVFKETLTEEEIKKAMTDKSIFELTIEEKDKEIERLKNIIKELSKDVDMWNRKYNEQFNIINEFERWLDEMEKYYLIVFYSVAKDKLKELKEGKE